MKRAYSQSIKGIPTKKRKNAVTKNEDNKFLMEFRFFLTPIGIDMTEKRLRFFQKQIEDKGGTVINYNCQARDSKIKHLIKCEVTHVVLTEEPIHLRFEKIAAYFCDTLTEHHLSKTRLLKLAAPKKTAAALPSETLKVFDYHKQSAPVTQDEKINFTTTNNQDLDITLFQAMLGDEDSREQLKKTEWNSLLRMRWITVKYLVESLRSNQRIDDLRPFDVSNLLLREMKEKQILETKKEKMRSTHVKTLEEREEVDLLELCKHMEPQYFEQTKNNNDVFSENEYESPEIRRKNSNELSDGLQISPPLLRDELGHRSKTIFSGRPMTRYQTNLWKNRHRFACQRRFASSEESTPINIDPQIEDEAAWQKEALRRMVGKKVGPKRVSPSNTRRIEEKKTVANQTLSETSELTSSVNSTVNCNPEITAMLKRFEDIYGGRRDEQWRERAYRVASSIISKLPFKIQTSKDLDRLSYGIGKKIKDKEDPQIKTIQLFSNIWGVGSVLAEKFYNIGLRTLNDLKKRPELLNDNQKRGLEFYNDFLEKIPRAEVHEIIHRVRVTANRLFGKLNMISIVGAGSFRRGKKECGDVDLLMTRLDDITPSNELACLVSELYKEGLITHHLNELQIEKLNPGKSRTYMGICQLKPKLPHRRIDIKMYLKSEFAFALLHFTSGSYFNRSMRYYAKKMGLSLTDHGLFPVLRHKDQKFQAGQPFVCETERDIFDALGLDYRPPHQRDADTGWINGLATLQKQEEKELRSLGLRGE